MLLRGRVVGQILRPAVADRLIEQLGLNRGLACGIERYAIPDPAAVGGTLAFGSPFGRARM